MLLLSYNGKYVPSNSIEKETLHDLCVHFIFADLVKGPFGVQWKEHLSTLSTLSSLIPAWRSLYTAPISKHSGDLQWRLVHWILPCNVLLHKLSNEILEVCPLCENRETLYHAYVGSTRLVPLFNLLHDIFLKLGFAFSFVKFIYGCAMSSVRKHETALVNFLIAEAKMSIYKTRKKRWKVVIFLLVI